jgi:hypothetical protein
VQNNEIPFLTVDSVDVTSVVLKWQPPRDLQNITGYLVEYRVSGTGPWTQEPVDGAGMTTYRVDGLTSGTTYEFRVDTKVNGSPVGSPSNIVTATPITDTVLDCSTAVPSLDRLWPPNHKLVPISVLGVIDPDGGDITVSIDGVFQDEPVNGEGDGNTRPDATGIGTGTASVRAERAGGGNGRVYTLVFTASSEGGAQCTDSVQVGVPKSPKRDAVFDGLLYNSVLD